MNNNKLLAVTCITVGVIRALVPLCGYALIVDAMDTVFLGNIDGPWHFILGTLMIIGAISAWHKSLIQFMAYEFMMGTVDAAKYFSPKQPDAITKKAEEIENQQNGN